MQVEPFPNFEFLGWLLDTGMRLYFKAGTAVNTTKKKPWSTLVKT